MTRFTISLFISVILFSNVRSQGQASSHSLYNPTLLKEGKSEFDVSMIMQGEQMHMTLSRTIIRTTAGTKKIVRIVETSKGDLEQTIDTVDYDAETLFPVSQRKLQGTTKIIFNFSDTMVSGSIQPMDRNIPVNTTLTQPTLPVSTSADAIIATLPFGNGYETTISMFDMMSALERDHSVKVLAKEKITVSNGSAVVYKIEILPVEGDGIRSMMWVKVSDHTIIKTETTLPEMMGSGTIITALK